MLSIIALNTFIAFHYCFKYHLSLCALSLFNAFHYYFKYIYRFPQRFKYIYCFHYVDYCFIYYDYPIPHVFGRENP